MDINFAIIEAKKGNIAYTYPFLSMKSIENYIFQFIEEKSFVNTFKYDKLIK